MCPNRFLRFLSLIVLPCRRSSFSLILIFSKNGSKSLSEKRTSTQGYAEQKHSGQSLPKEEQLSAMYDLMILNCSDQQVLPY